MKIEVQIVNAFVSNNTGGNPAGVVLDADSLTDVQRLKIAAQVGTSETAFVSKSSAADFKLDFFTPNRQIAHCGHATVATFSYLAQLGLVKNNNTSKETIDGRREILLNGDLAFMEQRAPYFKEVPDFHQDILSSLNLNEDDLLPNKKIKIVNTGNSFLIIPIRSQQHLKDINPNFDLIHKTSDNLDLIGYYLYTTETVGNGFDFSTRMFAPRYAITEEAGTGMAAGPLACYGREVLGIDKTSWLIEQGQFMNPPSPSKIHVELEIQNGQIQRLMAGGKGKVSKKITLDI